MDKKSIRESLNLFGDLNSDTALNRQTLSEIMGERNLSKNSQKTSNFSKLASKKFKEDEKYQSAGGSSNSRRNIFEKNLGT